MSNKPKPWLKFEQFRTTRSGGHFLMEMEATIMFGKETPGTGEIHFQLNGVDHSTTPVTGRAIVEFKNLLVGEHKVRATAIVRVDNTDEELSCERSFTLVPPDLSLDVSTPVKIGNSWQMTATATAFVPGKNPRIFAEDEEVKIFLNNVEMASDNTNDAGVFAYDFSNLNEGQNVVHAVLTSTNRKRQQVAQVGEKPAGPKKIIYSKTPKRGFMGATVLRITILDSAEPGKGKGVKDTKVWIEDSTLPDCGVECVTDSEGMIIHEVSVTEQEKLRDITITVPDADVSKDVTLRWRTELVP